MRAKPACPVEEGARLVRHDRGVADGEEGDPEVEKA